MVPPHPVRPSPVLAVRGISKTFRTATVLQDVSFSIDGGEILGLIGPNGAGKTTLFECVSGLLPADCGEVAHGERTLAAPERKQTLFYVPDGIRPWQNQSVGAVAGFFAGLHGRAGDDASGILHALKLEHVLNRRVWMLSKGESKRLTLALGLLTRQPVLMVDEPFDGLDLRQTREVMSVLRTEALRGRTIFVSIHQLNDAAHVCDRLVLLSGGRKVGEGTLDELKATAGVNDGGLEEVFLALT